MSIIDQKAWDLWVKNNDDSYGKCCVDVARKVMEYLDDEATEMKPYKLITRADKEIKAGGITGYMAGGVAQMVSVCHSRGEEFRKAWNIENQIGNEAEEINKGKGVINPAILTISCKTN